MLRHRGGFGIADFPSYISHRLLFCCPCSFCDFVTEMAKMITFQKADVSQLADT